MRQTFERIIPNVIRTAVPPPKVGSFDVITAIREANPFASFSWCLGADTFADLRRGRWRNGAEFAALCTQLYVVPRVGGAGAAWEEIEMGTTRGDDDGDGDGDDEREIDVLLSGMGGDGGWEGTVPGGVAEGCRWFGRIRGTPLGRAGFVRVDNASVMDIPGMSADVSSTAVRDALRRRRRRIHERERANGGEGVHSGEFGRDGDGRARGGLAAGRGHAGDGGERGRVAVRRRARAVRVIRFAAGDDFLTLGCCF